MVYAGYVKVGPGKAQTGRVKLQIRHAGTGEAKFSLGEGKISTGSGFTGSLTEGYFLGISATEKSVPPHAKNYDNFSRVTVIANQLLIRSSLYLAP